MAENQHIDELLNHVSSLLDMRRRISTPGERFNIFSVLDVESDEVNTHSRLIYELLRQNGSHGMGDVFLREFFAQVLEKPYPNSEVYVKREETIDNSDSSGRVDIIISGKDFRYPIEVKIYAGDQDKQIERYYNYAKAKQQTDFQVYYLTLDGKEPSNYSFGLTEKDRLTCISFKYHIRKWLERCAEIAWRAPSISEIICQYIKLLDKLTGNLEEDIFMEKINNLVRRSKENYESALAIEKILPDIRKEMMIGFFKEIEKHMEKLCSNDNKLQKLCPDYYYKAEEYYKNKSRNHPSVSYRIKDCNGITIALRFGVDYRFGYGVSFYNNNNNKKLNYCEIDSSLIKDAFKCKEWEEAIRECFSQDKRSSKDPEEGVWLWWRYLPSEYEKEKETSDEIDINFRTSNGLYTDLFNPEKHKALMEEIFEKIDRQINSILETGLPTE